MLVMGECLQTKNTRHPLRPGHELGLSEARFCAKRSAYGGGSSRTTPPSRCWIINSPSPVEVTFSRVLYDAGRAGHGSYAAAPLDEGGIADCERCTEPVDSEIDGSVCALLNPASVALLGRRMDDEGKLVKPGRTEADDDNDGV